MSNSRKFNKPNLDLYLTTNGKSISQLTEMEAKIELAVTIDLIEELNEDTYHAQERIETWRKRPCTLS